MSLAGPPSELAGVAAVLIAERGKLRSDGGTVALLKRRAQAKVTAVVV